MSTAMPRITEGSGCIAWVSKPSTAGTLHCYVPARVQRAEGAGKLEHTAALSARGQAHRPHQVKSPTDPALRIE